MDYSAESIDVDADGDWHTTFIDIKPEDLTSLLKSMNETKGI